jgi:hypothetical protein
MALYALLVGVDKYAKPGVTPLNGPSKDVGRMVSFLQSHFAPASLEYKTLLKTDATKAAVVDAFTTHLMQAGADDHALFYFSGHGALEKAHQAFIKNGIDKPLESLVCYDSMHTDTTLADKELRYLLNKLAENCPNIVVITDCCHSGGVTRNPEMILKRLAGEVPARNWDQFIFHPAITEDAVMNGSLKDVLPEGAHIHFAACQSRQSAWEVRGAGIFTANLLQVLQQTNGNISYQDLFSRTRYLVANRFDQVPDIFVHGTNSQQYVRKLFAGGVPAGNNVPNANIVFNNPTSSWILDKGAFHGVQTSNGEFNVPVFGAGEQPLTYARVTAVLPDHSRVELKDPNIPVASYSAMVSGCYQKALNVVAEGEANGIAELDSFYQRTKAVYQADGIFLEKDLSRADYVIQAFEGKYWLEKPGGFKSGDPKPLVKEVINYTPASAEQVFNYLVNISRWEFYRSLTNEQTKMPGFPLQIEFHYTSHDGQEQVVVAGQDNVLTFPYTAADNFACTIKLSNVSDQPYYAAVVYLGLAFEIIPDMVTGGVEYLEKQGGRNAAAWLNEGDTITFEQEPFTAEFNNEYETYWLLLIASTDTFNISAVQQDPLPLPVRSKTTYRSVRRAAISVPEADWNTRLVCLRFRNPSFNPDLNIKN